MATHSSILAWKIPWMEEPGRLHRVIKEWDTKFSLATKHKDMLTVNRPYGSAGKESAHSAGDLGSVPGQGRSPREGKVYPLQYAGLENFMDCIVHGVTKSRTQLSDFHSLTPFGIIRKIKRELKRKKKC